MPIKGFGSTASISGIEELLTINITGEVDQIQVEPGTANTAVTVVTYYNPRYTASISGLSDGSTTAPGTITLYSTSFKVTAFNISESVGDVKKINLSAVHYPSVTT